MAYKDFFGNEHDTEDKAPEPNAMFFSRPLVLPGSAFGSLNFFFDPEEVSAQEIEALGHMIADFVDNYWVMKEKNSSVTN